MFYTIYNILSIFLLIPVCIYHLYRSASRGRKAAFGERFGKIAQTELKKIAGRRVIWLHAVSVGETIAARPLLKALRSRYPDYAIVVSNTTETGRQIASGFAEKDLVIYFPFDFLPAVCRVLDSLKPELIVIMETEIWPNFNREAARRRIPLILANGRISDRSYRRYLRFRWFFRHPLEFFSTLCMQTETDRERILAIGAPDSNTRTIGNMKYDIPYREVSEKEKQTLRKGFAIPDLLVFTAGSTHPGEEEPVIETYRELFRAHPSLFLVLVPRHPERAMEVAGLLQKFEIPFRLRSQLKDSDNSFSAGQVLLVDTVGELMALYALSDLVFVGGSLVPTGGHNLLEPASLGIPSIFGPHMTNFREIAALVLSYQAGLQIQNSDELPKACRMLIENSTMRDLLGHNGLKMMNENGGATQRHMEIIGNRL